MNNVINQNDELVNADATFKVTSLLYLKEALERERYEDCEEIVAAARSFGAQRAEISKVIAAYVRELKGGGQNEANRIQTRPRF